MFGFGKKKPAAQVKGDKASATLADDRLTLKHHGFINLLNMGATGDKTVHADDITAVEIRKPRLFRQGYIQFSYRGGQDAGNGRRGARTDENSVMFRGRKATKQAKQLQAELAKRR